MIRTTTDNSQVVFPQQELEFSCLRKQLVQKETFKNHGKGAKINGGRVGIEC